MPGPAPGVLRGGTWKFVLTPGTSSPLNELYDVESTSSTSCVTVGDSLRVGITFHKTLVETVAGALGGSLRARTPRRYSMSLRLLVHLGGLILGPSSMVDWTTLAQEALMRPQLACVALVLDPTSLTWASLGSDAVPDPAGRPGYPGRRTPGASRSAGKTRGWLLARRRW